MSKEPPAEPLWRIIPVEEFKAPSTPSKVTLRKKLALMLKRFRPKAGEEADRERLRTPDAAVIDQVLPRIGRMHFHRAMDAAVKEWAQRDEATSQPFVIVLPTGSPPDLMEQWAIHHKARLAEKPVWSPMFPQAARTLPKFGDDLLVIPKLEDWFRRHHGGLDLIRQLMNSLNHEPSRCVIGVASWAWTYLTWAAEIAVELPPPACLAAFDDSDLAQLFADIAEQPDSPPITFRRDDTGEVVLAPPSAQAADGKKPVVNGASDYFKVLAAASRGNPWLAWHLFRNSMRIQPKDPDAEASLETSTEVIWINVRAERLLPEMPKSTRAGALLVLQALLIHGELTLGELDAVLPPIRTVHLLHLLRTERILVEDGGWWRVAPAAYPAVREALSHHGFPSDVL